MGWPPHPQTAEDREALAALFPLFKGLPENFQFPIAVDPDYIPPVNSFYCLVSGITICIITTIVVVLRLWVRSRGVFGMDDWVMVPALLSYCAFNCVNLVGVLGTGLGYHLTDLSLIDIHNYLIIQFLHVIFWFLSLHLCRCSILHLLLRLAHLQSTTQRWYLRTVLICSYAFLAACVIFQIFECGTPVSRSFEVRSVFDGTCAGTNTVAVYGGLIAGHIGLDALTIFPPLLVLARLPLARGKKFNLSFLLVLGVFTMVFSAVRLFYFYDIMVSSYDFTWHSTAVAFWGILESSLAATIACLPALNQAIVRQIKRLYPHSDGSATLTNGFGVNRLERNNIYKGPAKFVSYSADATVSVGTGTMRDYVELGDINSNSEEALRGNAAATGGGSATSGDGGSAERGVNASDSYADITVERSFYVTEERAEDLEAQEREGERARAQREGEGQSPVAKPAIARLFGRGRRPSAPSRAGSDGADAASKV
ncbi:hypothetical protein TWF696_009298 [Orbilia brochopaga]|uniref:Rhodopsin domain-containing protein n=1 Tax=Orbilia brochopaga TaxID=3140254 RepID=A0AAV9UFR4_9PEZI